MNSGGVEILGLLACGTYHLYLLWATQENIIYQIVDKTAEVEER